MADQKAAAAAPAAKAADPKKEAKKEAAKKEKAAKKAAAAAAGAADGKKTDQKKEASKQRKAKAAKSAAPTAPVAAADTKHTVDGKEVKAPYLKKVVKAKGETVTEVDAQVARALLELEAKDLAAELTDLFITAAKEVDVGGKKAVVVFVPYRQHNKYKKIQSRLIRELEKKLSKNVVIIAQRTILSKNYSRVKKGQLRPRSRTLTAVHNSILDDLVYPTLIVGKRLRVRLDGSRLIKIHLDPKDSKEVEYKLKTFQAVYKKLTNKTVEFSFPISEDA